MKDTRPVMLVAIASERFHEGVSIYSTILKVGTKERYLWDIMQAVELRDVVAEAVYHAASEINDLSWPTLCRTSSKSFLKTLHTLDESSPVIQTNDRWGCIWELVEYGWTFDHYDDSSYYYRKSRHIARSIAACSRPDEQLSESQIQALGGRIDEQTIVRMWARANSNGWEKLGVRRLLAEMGVMSSADIPKALLSDIMKTLGSRLTAERYNDIWNYSPWEG